MPAIERFTLLLVIFTAALVWVGWLQRRTLDETLRSNRVVERAYVGMSHVPGSFQLSPGPPFTAQVRLRVKNHGNTPARVTAVSSACLAGPTAIPMPATAPDMTPQPDSSYFLVAGDEFFLTTPPSPVPAPATHAQVQAGTVTLYLIGRVDYEDQFGQRHRCSYARRYAVAGPGGPDL